MKRRLSLLLVAALALGGASLAPASIASAAGTTTGTIKVQVQTLHGTDLHKKNFYVSVTNMSHKSITKQAKTNSNGTATVHVPQGKYTIRVLTYMSYYQYAVAKQDYIAIQRGQSKIIGMKLYKGGQVTGKVLSPTGFAIKGASVAAVTRKGVPAAITTADKKGAYRLAGLPTGKYAIVFNYRNYDDGKSKANSTYWSGIYKGTSLANAKYVQVYEQNKYAAATKTTGISGPVSRGSNLNVTLAQKNSASGRLLVDHVTSARKYIQFGSVYAPFTNGTSAKVRIGTGTYRLGVVYAGVSYYYTGYGQTLTRDPNLGMLMSFTGADVYVAFGPLPAT